MLLAIACAHTPGELGLLDGAVMRARVALGGEAGIEAALTDDLDLLFERAATRPRDVRRIAVTIGPGGYTGVRLGVTLAKSLAYAWGVELAGVCAYAARAELAPPGETQVLVAEDIRGEQIGWALYQRRGDQLHELSPPKACDRPPELDAPCWVRGSALESRPELFAGKAGFRRGEGALVAPGAIEVARLAARPETIWWRSPHDLSPVYLRGRPPLPAPVRHA